MNPSCFDSSWDVFNAAHNAAYAQTLKDVIRSLNRWDSSDPSRALTPAWVVSDVRPRLARVVRLAEGGLAYRLGRLLSVFKKPDAQAQERAAHYKALWLEGVKHARECALGDASRAIYLATLNGPLLSEAPAEIVRAMPVQWPSLPKGWATPDSVGPIPA